MQRDKFLAMLDALINEAKESNDAVVRPSAVVLLGLRGSISAGDGYFEAFVDNVAMVIRNQHDAIINTHKKER